MARPECVAHTHAAVPLPAFAAYREGIADIDLRGELPRLACPTRLLLPRGRSYSSIEAMQQMATSIPDCEVHYLEAEMYPYRGGTQFDERVRAISEFFVGPSAQGPTRIRGGLQTLLFTDLESSTALTQALGDAKAQEVLRGHNDAVRTALEVHGGEEVKHTGDGIFAAFGSAVSAVEKFITATSADRSSRSSTAGACG